MAAYDTYTNADTYFGERLHVIAWLEASSEEKTKALKEASARIDRLRFSGVKVDDAQDLEFPRYYGDDPDGTEVIPTDIKIACYELAYTLIDGVDPDQEFENMAVGSQGYSSVRMSRSVQALSDHLAAGIPSPTAWRYLMPYLASARKIQIRRV